MSLFVRISEFQSFSSSGLISFIIFRCKFSQKLSINGLFYPQFCQFRVNSRLVCVRACVRARVCVCVCVCVWCVCEMSSHLPAVFTSHILLTRLVRL